ncbi:hypothetical protein ABZ192_12520 [Streptomyces sp. NPDC006235]|jgi:hypothetical protein|uniref:hypothetical protein n=1 Tax=Streptomyces sp. NPDC006235 TaxID=3156736 RepID=UPI0033BF1176
MTASGQRLRAENVAAPKPSRTGQRPAAKITARTPLPKGWASFCSEPDSQNPGRWYATAPWNVFGLKEQYGPKAEYLAQMVDAPTWVELHKKVNAQVTLYESLERGQE